MNELRENPATARVAAPVPERRQPKEIKNLTVTTLYSGQFYVTNQPGEMIETILGSCVAACMYDPVAKIGGMNHFLLPDTLGRQDGNVEESARYGVFAMEQLINGIMQMGGAKHRLEVKVFGGGNVIKNSAMIGTQNVAFVKDFLSREGLQIRGGDLGADYPRRVRFYPDTGKAQMLKLKRKADFSVVDEERRFAHTLAVKPIEGEIELFS